MLKWSEMFPNGRNLFYEGTDPEGFVREMKSKYKFDPTRNNQNSLWDAKNGYQFDCPAEHIDEIYGKGRYPLGS